MTQPPDDFASGVASDRRPTAFLPTSSFRTPRFASSPQRRPETTHELAAVKGFGPARIERYGDDILALLAR